MNLLFNSWKPLRLLFVIIIISNKLTIVSSQSIFQNFFIPADSFQSKRAILAGTFAAAAYSGFSIGLYHAWYKDQGLGSFHLFNDHGEWLGVDKAAHAYNAYVQSSLCYQGARWCGYSEKSSLLWANGIALLFQSTVEVMDGFGKGYGFSWPDMAANFFGAGFFTGQQVIWREQKFKLKLSSWPQDYSDLVINEHGDPGYNFKDRARELYGSGFLNSALKDYNAQTYWLSFNPENIFNQQWEYWPDWLNLSFGFGADGLFGGYSNQWIKNGVEYNADRIARVQEYFVSLDIDLSKVKTKNHFLKTLFSVINIIKLPAPALSINSKGEWKGYGVFY